MGKIVFFDIDGTLWDEENKIPESTKVAIQKLRANGHKAIICSGRARGNIRNLALLEMGFDGIIAACGNHVELDGEIIYEKIIPPALVKKIIEVCKEHRMPIVMEGPSKHWLDGEGFEEDPYVDFLMEELGDDAIILDGYTEEIHVNKFSALIHPHTNITAIQEALEADFDFLFHTGAVLECVPAGTSKATGIKWLCSYLDIAKDDMYAIGDSVNDLDMLRYVDHSICMGNGTAPAKEVAEYITRDIHEDGIYRALEHYGLI
jgi:Cof subfamily protein (haloacid dehalogenase superfamily)